MTGGRWAPLVRRALWLAERGGGATAPNPMVGCVIVDDGGNVLGEGFHRRAGEPHAEVVALEAAARAGHDPRGATAIVSLEPCAHEGKTPPCVDRLVEAGVVRVVHAAPDPHAGAGGAERLQAAGVEVVGGVLAGEAEQLNEAWLHRERTGRPFFHLKTAQTLSGHVTRGRGGGRWITGVEARREVHRLRRRHRAVLVGSGTVQADDPRLTVRDWPPPGGPPGDEAAGTVAWPDVQPLRVVLDSRLRLPEECRVVATATEVPTVVFCRPDAPADRAAALEDRGVAVNRVPPSGEGLDLRAVTAVLAESGVTGVLVEPGPTLTAALLEEGLADRWTAFLSPDWTTSRSAYPALGDVARGIEVRLARPEWRAFGPDAAVSGLVEASPTDRAAGDDPAG